MDIKNIHPRTKFNLNQLNSIIKLPNKLPFNNNIVSFVNEFSITLINDPRSKKYPEIISLAYWFRKANLKRLKSMIESNPNTHQSIGTIFHICPSNVDTIFVYSFFISLLCGNKNIIRISQKNSEQMNIILNSIYELHSNKKFKDVLKRFQIITYEHSDKITLVLSELCDRRVIWGSDPTINTIKNIPTKLSSVDILFPDRHSSAIIKNESLVKISSQQLSNLAKKLINEISMFGQLACSSPRTIFLIGSPNKSVENFISILKKTNLNDLSSSEVMDKYVSFTSHAVQNEVSKIESKNLSNINILYPNRVNDEVIYCNSGNGSILLYYLKNIKEIYKYLEPKEQTLSYYGFKKEELITLAMKIENRAVDRIVPIGEALNFDYIWDGINLLESFTRKIVIR